MANTIWNRDELIVVLDVYLNDEFVLDSSDPLVKELADLIGRTPGSVVLRLSNYRHLDPNGSQGMSNVGENAREVWEEYYRNEEQLAIEATQARKRLRGESHETLEEGSNIPETGERESVRKSRVGQGDFRMVLRARFGDCCLLCDVSRPGLLQAGHILDWSKFEEERGNPDNGLLMCYTHHRAFDLNLFTISEDFELIVNPEFSDPGEFMERTVVDQNGKRIDFNDNPPSKELLKIHNENLSWIDQDSSL